jgi:hypothetical protein
MGGPGNDGGKGIISDASDNIYVTGYFEQTADFAPGRNDPSTPLPQQEIKIFLFLK